MTYKYWKEGIILVINQLEKVVKCNEVTEKFGLKLSNSQAIELLEYRQEILAIEQRVEFNEGILNQLIFVFCDSPFIIQENYVETIEGIQEIFYNFKNQYEDRVSDDELLDFMKNYFDGECQGSLDYLEEKLWIKRSTLLWKR